LSRTAPVRVAGTALAAAVVTSGLWAGAGRLWWLALDRVFAIPLDQTRAAALFALLTGLGAVVYALSVTVHYVLQAYEDSSAAMRRALESQVGQREAELRALRAQVDPHFLFNSLNSISGLIATQPEQAREMCHLLAEFLRDSLTLGATERIALGREVALAEQYLQIERVRFGTRLRVATTIDAACAATPVPPLLIQPLVENAVRHGIATRLDGGVIELSARRQGELASVAVSNPRDADGARRGLGFGLDIVRRRLAAAWGDRATLAIEAEPERYSVVLTLPVEERDGSRPVPVTHD
jgi:LytS/YehU family sensor histidine kinase